MTSDNIQTKLDYIGQIEDLVARTASWKDPFLYYLPRLLATPQFQHINAADAYSFTKMALQPSHPDLIKDALHILNSMVDPHDGSLKNPGPDVFYNNRNFFWKELGNHTKAVEVIMHVLNKTMFVSSLGTP